MYEVLDKATRISNAVEAEIVATLTSLVDSGGRYIDDHGHSGREATAYAVARFEVGEHKCLVLLFKNVSFCINPVELNDHDGKVHLRTGSVGGVVNYREHLTLEEAIIAYNERSKETFQWGGQIGEVTYF